MVTAEELCYHLGVEPEWYEMDRSVQSEVDRALKVGIAGLLGEVGYHPGLLDDPRAESLVLAKATDAYEQRQETDTRTTAKKLYTQMARIDQDLLMQMRCEYYYPWEQGLEELDFQALADELAESAERDGCPLMEWVARWVARFGELYGGAE